MVVRMKKIVVLILIMGTGIVLQVCGKPAQAKPKITEQLDIAEVPSGFPVSFCLLTHGRRQFLACNFCGRLACKPCKVERTSSV